MQKQTVANYARTKVYTKADSETLVLLSPRNKKGLPLQSFLLVEINTSNSNIHRSSESPIRLFR